MSSGNRETARQRATYTVLSGVFLTIFAIFSRTKAAREKELKLGPFDLLQLALASYRLGRLVAYDRVFETYRLAVTDTIPDPSGAGDTVAPKGGGVRRALGELVCCPICTGTWIAAGLVYALHIAPRPTRILVAIMSAVGLAELVDAATEALQWSGQIARERAGTERSAKMRAAGL